MSAALTPWFPEGTKPVHQGVYQTSDKTTYQYWDGECWGYCASEPAKAMSPSEYAKGTFQNPIWRGLAYDPSVTP